MSDIVKSSDLQIGVRYYLDSTRNANGIFVGYLDDAFGYDGLTDAFRDVTYKEAGRGLPYTQNKDGITGFPHDPNEEYFTI